MSKRITKKISQSKDTVVSIIVTKEIFPALRRDSHHREVVNFSRRPDVQALTRKYLDELSSLWNERIRKPATNPVLQTSAAGIPTLTSAHSPVLQHTPVQAPTPKIQFTLPNAKAGEVYSARIIIQGQTLGRGVIIQSVQFDPDVGLTSQAGDVSQIFGTPTKDGEVKVHIGFQFQDASPTSPILHSETTLFINPDPKSLWKKLPSDKNDPYFKPDEDIGHAQASGGRTMIAASRRGRSHEHTGAFRDDDFFLGMADGWDILAVADGAGSAKLSRRGAQIAVSTAVETLQNSLSHIHGNQILAAAKQWHVEKSGSQHPVKVELYETLGRAAFAAVKAIEEEAVAKSAPTKDYSTTLLVAIHKQSDFGHLFACYWVGDGAAAVYQKDKGVIVLGMADSGEYAGQTRFLDKQVMTPEQVMQRLNFAIVDDFTGLIMMTDGISDPKFETDSNLGKVDKWDDLWRELEPLLTDRKQAADELLKWLEFWSPGNHDDRTIVALY